MEQTFIRCIVAGIFIGQALGLLWGMALGNLAVGWALGALGGVFAGWFAAAAAMQKSLKKPEQRKQ